MYLFKGNQQKTFSTYWHCTSQIIIIIIMQSCRVTKSWILQKLFACYDQWSKTALCL